MNSTTAEKSARPVVNRVNVAFRSMKGEAAPMGFYRESVVPHLIRMAMKKREVTPYRRQLIPQALGCVLEIGIGSGLNLPFYGPRVTRVLGLDPSPRLLELAGQYRGSTAFPLELVRGTAEAIPVRTGSVDTVVSTWTLCSVPDAGRALAEMRRVLKPAGRLLFVEHGLTPEPDLQRWQRRLTPLWQRVTGGCRLDRKVDDLIVQAGFDIETLATGYARGPKLTTFFYQGAASPRVESGCPPLPPSPP